MYQLQYKRELIGVAFYDAQIFISTCQTIKNYIMIGDMYKSIYFLRWKVRTLA
jgi:cleavage and polyadenylation specificity factor subunit 1